MHPHTDSEDQTLLSSNYGIYVRTVVAIVRDGVFAEEAGNTGPAIPRWGRGVAQLRPTLKSILGYEPFLSARISADLEQPVMSADIRLHLGGQNWGDVALFQHGENWQNIAPLNFLTNNTAEGGSGPYWDWVSGRRRALLDTGIYIRLESKLVSQVPTVVVPPPPEIENIGPQVASTSPDPVAVPWPQHSTGRVGVLVVQSANEAVTLDTPAGFVEVGTAQGIGTAGSGTGVSFGNATEFTGTANPTTASHAAVANTKGVLVFITQPIVSTDIVTGVTYGGTAMTRVDSRADPNATAGGRIYAYFLGTSVPAGTQTVNVARSQTTTTIHVVVNGIVAGVNTEVVTSAGQASSDATGGMSNPFVTLNYGGRSALGFVGMYSSIDNIIGTGTEPAGQQRVHDHDFGTETSIVSRRTSAESSNQTMGWTFNGQRLAQLAVAVAEISGAATRIHTYWARATSNAMAAPLIAQPGNHFMAFIYTVRNALDAGTPINTTAGSTEAADTSVSAPAVTPTARSLVVNHVAIATDTSTPQFTGWANANLGFSETGPSGIITYTAAERVDRATTIGLGGGIGIFSGPKQTSSSTGSSTATLATASVKAMQTLAFTPQAIRAVATDPASVPWRPFFVGRIDTVDPAEDNSDVLTLHCRDVHCDVLDPWIVPGIGTNGVQFDSSQIEDLLGDMLAFAQSAVVSDIPFAVVGNPDMGVPSYFQEPMSVLLAMRQAGLQNAWDLRGRWGTSPYGENVYVLTYYEPDRALLSNPFDLGPSRYFEIGSFPLSREEVRNTVEVIPGEPPRTPIRLTDTNSEIDYGSSYMRLAYDKTSLIRTAAQGTTLATGVLSDVSRPKTQAEVLTRFHPWIEINDRVRLAPNFIHHGGPLALAVSGFEHNLTEDGNGTTVIRTRVIPAAAGFREWRRGADLLTSDIVSQETPSGIAPEKTIWSQVIGQTSTTPPPPTGTSGAPTYISAGNFAGSTSGVSPSWPSGHRANDIGLLEVQTGNQALGTTPAGWAYIGTLPVGTGTAGAAGSVMAHWLWKRATSSAESAASIGDSGDHQVARIHLIRGAITTGSPINVASTPVVVTSAGTGVVMAGATTTVDRCLVLAYVANAIDLSTPQTPSGSTDWFNADLTGKQVIASVQTGQGNGGGMSAMVGVKATAGAYTFSSTSLTNASKQITGSFAITPVPA